MPGSVWLKAVARKGGTMPDIPQEWSPPGDPDGGSAPPEFTPPTDPMPGIGSPPEYSPPEREPPSPGPGRTPMRPLPPEEEPKIPDPEGDPLKNPQPGPAPPQEPEAEPETDSRMSWGVARASQGIPEIPQEWKPPRDPGGTPAPPEFIPPSDPKPGTPGVPEIYPDPDRPKKAPGPSRPMRPLPPDEDPKIPDPEDDPLKNPKPGPAPPEQPDRASGAVSGTLRQRASSSRSSGGATAALPHNMQDESDEEEEEEEEVYAQTEEDAHDDEEDAVGDDEEYDEEVYSDEDGAGSEVAEYIEYCQDTFQIDGLIEIDAGVGGLPVITLKHPTGASAQLYMHGANVTSWRKPNGREILYVRSDSQFDGLTPIKGGIPISFPQYGRGQLPADGFARELHWSLYETVRSPLFATDPAPTVSLIAEEDDDTLQVWPHRFQAMYTVSLMQTDEFEPLPGNDPEHFARDGGAESMEPSSKSSADTGSGPSWRLQSKTSYAEVEKEVPEETPIQLRCVLQIANTDDEPFTFTTALQGHFATADLRTTNQGYVRTLGLGGKYVFDYSMDPAHPKVGVDEADYVYFGADRLERVYVDSHKGDVKFCPGDPTHIEVRSREGFKDLGVANPYLGAPNDYAHFASLQPACVTRPVTLAPGETWKGEVVFRNREVYWQTPLFEMGPTLATPGFENISTKRTMPPIARPATARQAAMY
ncbi:hypothetical protein WJX72_009001 [[Myrmecia] bisecta]|uniref:Glucose-6-phosphate 1-epimerase n=1 Tax=[Myrmecia] bisecta TaxID=41462 RepID=A0AAW1P5L2_9CHLO